MGYMEPRKAPFDSSDDGGLHHLDPNPCCKLLILPEDQVCVAKIHSDTFLLTCK